MHKKHMFLRVFQKITLFACVFCAFFISPAFATLPAGYTELEYIESTGTQYIDTDYKFLTNDNFELEFTFLYPTLSTIEKKVEEGLIGNYTTSTWGAFTAGVKYGKFFFYTNGGNFNDMQILANTLYNVKYVVSGTNLSASINGALFTQDLGDSTDANREVLLFNRGDLNDTYFTGRNYGVKIVDNNSLVRNFIPAKRNSDNEIGMYDTVSDTFFTNQGTGDFIAGPIAHCKTFGTDGVMCTACESGYKLDSNGVCVGVIEIATTKMVDEEFAAAEANLAATVQTIESVVSRTIAQTGQIQILQDTKQTRPDENCPANMKCLLVQDEDGTPHWYPIIEP